MEQMEVETKNGELERLQKQREAKRVASWLGVEEKVVEEMDRKVEGEVEVKKESEVDKRIEASMGRVKVAMKERGKMERDIEYLERKVQDYNKYLITNTILHVKTDAGSPMSCGFSNPEHLEFV